MIRYHCRSCNLSTRQPVGAHCPACGGPLFSQVVEVRTRDVLITNRPTLDDELDEQDWGTTDQIDTRLHLVVLLGRRQIAEYRLTQELITIGRDPIQSVVIDNPSVSRLHCQIRFDGFRYILNDRGTPNGTRVNGEEKRRAELEPGDEITINKFVILFQPAEEQLCRLESSTFPVAAAAPLDPNATTFLNTSERAHVSEALSEAREAYVRIVFAGRMRGRRISLFRDMTILGSSSAADIPLRGWFIGSRHVLIIRSAESFRLIHTAGMRAVKVNGQVVKERRLDHEDEISIGRNRITFYNAV